MIQENTGAQTNSYVYGLDLSGSMQGAGTIGGILSASLNGSQAFYFYDANGNVSDLAASNGTSLAHYEFDPYGNTIVASGTQAAANPFRFSTKYTDDETGLLYYGYRYYAPGLGRWLSRDPMGENASLCLYAFVNNRPSISVDPFGLWEWPWTGCCKGVKYNIFSRCCCNGVILSKGEIDTGVAERGWTASDTRNSGWNHTWLTYPGGSVGYNAFMNPVINSPDLFELGLTPPYRGTYDTRPIKLSPCDYNISSFVECIKNFASTWTPSGNCSTFVYAAKAKCLKDSKGCGL
jgi:RHS repeat-associated protein